MKRFLLPLLLLGACKPAATQRLAEARPSGAREIAFTFDDAPRPASRHFNGAQRADALVAALRDGGIRQAAFFCNTRGLGDEGRERLKTYGAAGHLLANHTATHGDLDRMTAPAFLDDVKAAHATLMGMNGFRAWFRFPYLHEGKTTEVRDAVREGLAGLGYHAGYVTVDTYDWFMDTLLQQAISAGKQIDWATTGNTYVDLLAHTAKFFAELGDASGQTNVRHVMLLHENDMAALFVDDLARRLVSDGWKIVTADEAYAAPLATPATLEANQGRLAALARDKGYAGTITSPWENESAVRDAFARAGAW